MGLWHGGGEERGASHSRLFMEWEVLLDVFFFLLGSFGWSQVRPTICCVFFCLREVFVRWVCLTRGERGVCSDALHAFLKDVLFGLGFKGRVFLGESNTAESR